MRCDVRSVFGKGAGRAVAVAVAVATALPSVRADGPSAEYQAGLRKTLERRKQRRQIPARAPVGTIMTYPMPPTLIIRQTPEAHDEIQALLDLLRYGGR